MHIKDKVVLVTGGASGIGAALCRRFARERARAVVVADLDEVGARSVAEAISGVAMACDVAVETDVQRIVSATELRFGQLDLVCSNAGIFFGDGPEGRATLHEKVTYIYRLQQMEADFLAINKCDLLTPAELDEMESILRERCPGRGILKVSARTGAGFDELARIILGTAATAWPTSPAAVREHVERRRLDADAYAATAVTVEERTFAAALRHVADEADAALAELEAAA